MIKYRMYRIIQYLCLAIVAGGMGFALGSANFGADLLEHDSTITTTDGTYKGIPTLAFSAIADWAGIGLMCAAILVILLTLFIMLDGKHYDMLRLMDEDE